MDQRIEIARLLQIVLRRVKIDACRVELLFRLRAVLHCRLQTFSRPAELLEQPLQFDKRLESAQPVAGHRRGFERRARPVDSLRRLPPLRLQGPQFVSRVRQLLEPTLPLDELCEGAPSLALEFGRLQRALDFLDRGPNPALVFLKSLAPVGQLDDFRRDGDAGEEHTVRVVCVGVAAQLCRFPGQSLDFRPLLPEPLGEVRDGYRAGVGLALVVVGQSRECRDLGVVDFGLSLRLGGSGLRLGRDPLVEAEPEKPVQQILPRFRLVVKKARERSLWKNDASGELIESQADAFDHGLGHLGRPGCDHLVFRLETRFLRRGLAGVRCNAPDNPGDGIVLFVEREVAADTRLVLSLADYRLDQLLVVEAGHAAVQREDHRVDDARLAGAGRAHDDEEVGFLEVDYGPLAVGGESLKFDSLRFHTPPPGVP